MDLSITFFLSPKSVRAFPNYEKLSATQRTMSLIRLLWFWWERKTIGNAAKQKTKLYAHCRKITQMQMQMMWKFISLVLFAQRIGRQPTKKKHFDYDTCMVCVTGACDMFRCPLNVSGAFFFCGCVCAEHIPLIRMRVHMSATVCVGVYVGLWHAQTVNGRTDRRTDGRSDGRALSLILGCPTTKHTRYV